jgi:hypothetical protein
MTRFSAPLFLLILLFATCRTDATNETSIDTINVLESKEREVKKYSDTIDWAIYNNVIETDTNNCESFYRGRGLEAALENKKVVVETNSVDLYLRTDKLRMWVCNLPKAVTNSNLGDTIVVSASVFNIFGDERTWGKPTVLHKLVMRDGKLKRRR